MTFKGDLIKRCVEKDCKNKFFAFDRISPTCSVACCRKHYRMYALGWSEWEASRGRKECHLRKN